MDSYQRPSSFSDRRGSQLDLGMNSVLRMDKISQQRLPPRGPPTPSMSTPAPDFDQQIDQQQVSGSPPPPPTPAASPGLLHDDEDWDDAEGSSDLFLHQYHHFFKSCSSRQRTTMLASLLKLCSPQELSFVHQFVTPLLKKDPFTSLPDELCLRVCPHPHYYAGVDHDTEMAGRFCRLLTTPKSLLGPLKFRGDGEI